MKVKVFFLLSVASVILFVNTVNVFAINPQPEPPGVVSTIKIVNPGVLVGFNPQPEPPGDSVLHKGIIQAIKGLSK
ncbi:MAG TPA: hypothetical protein VF941_13015 [Clostridia bacterium]